MELPLFPLSSPLLPYGRMSLQIFEPRYLSLVSRCMRESSGFGVVWLRQGPEVAGRGEPELAEWGTLARIVDFDQLPNGLLGVVIQGGERFQLERSWRQADQLTVGEVTLEAPLTPAPMEESWVELERVLRSLELHPEVERLGLSVDYSDAWQVAFSLLQLLPLEQRDKYELLRADDAAALMAALDGVLSEISGE